MSRAFYIVRTGRPGPVVLDFPKNAQVDKTEWKPAKVDFVRSYVPYPTPEQSAIEVAAELINSAKRPLALVGHGVELGGAQNELVEFIEKADIPAARTLLGLSALPTDHPLNMGMIGMHGNYAPNIKTQEADVIIAIGMRFSDRDTGTPSTYAKQAKIIHLEGATLKNRDAFSERQFRMRMNGTLIYYKKCYGPEGAKAFYRYRSLRYQRLMRIAQVQGKLTNHFIPAVQKRCLDEVYEEFVSKQ